MRRPRPAGGVLAFWLSVSFALLVVVAPGSAAGVRPPDVPGDHWAAPAVLAVTHPEVDLVELFPGGTFRGATNLTKYDLVKSLDNLVTYLEGKGVRLGPQGALPPLPYTDVPGDHWATRAIRRMLWVIPGDRNLFRGGQTMTRLDMAVWLYQLLKEAPVATNVKLGPAPPDVDAMLALPARWALAAGEEGLISRYPDGRFHPDRDLTRYEMAYTLHRVLRWLTPDTIPQPVETPPTPVAQDQRPPEIRVFEPDVEEAKDFAVVPRKKQVAVTGVAADDTAIAAVTVNGQTATLAFADEADLQQAGLKGPAAVWFRTQVPAPAEGGQIVITATDKTGKQTQRRFALRPPQADSPQVQQAVVQPPGTQRVGRKWALLIGVNQYDDAENIATLRYSVRDVTAVYEALVDPERGGFDRDTVFLLTDNTPDKPTNINIIKFLNRIARRAEPEDLVLIYYSGHGYEENGKGYILPCNTDIEALAASAVDNTDFIDTLDRMKAQRIVTILDACHSGAVKRTSGTGGLGAQYYNAYGGGKGRVVLASSSAGQQSWEDPKLKQGVFTQYVKTGLMGEADRNRDGAITFMELARYVSEHVRRWAQANGKEQEPTIQAKNFAASDIVLALNPAAKPTGPLAEKKRVIYTKLDPEDADYSCALLEKQTLTAVEKRILQYLDQMVSGKITPERYLDMLRTLRPAEEGS